MSRLKTFIFGFIAGFISMLIEEKTKIVNFVIMSIFVRTIHAILLVLFKKFNIYQEDSTTMDYLKYLLAATLICSVYFLNPNYKPVTNLFDKYAHYPSDYELKEAIAIRQSTKIVS